MSKEESSQISSDLFEQIRQGTIATKKTLWQMNIAANEESIRTGQHINELFSLFKNRPAIVVGAGPSMHKRGIRELKQIYKYRNRPLVIACDGALPIFGEAGLTPDFICSLDGASIVAKFYWRSLPDKPKGVLLCSTVHPNVVISVREHKWPIYWWQPAFTEDPLLSDLMLDDLTWIRPGGNVGTTSWVMAWELFKCLPIGLMGIEFAWSDETPLTTTQYFDQLYKMFNGDMEKVKKHYVTIYNPIMKKNYIADPVYYFYSVVFQDMLKNAPSEVKKGTYSLTPEGIICSSGIKFTTIKEFLKL